MKIRISIACLCVVGSLCSPGQAQTPEETKAWEAQRAQTQVEARARAERLAREREARRADPMAWVKTLEPMAAGGWEFRSVAPDGSWAVYTTLHQMKRSGRQVTIWLRQEYPESQRGDDGSAYLSYVEKMQYDCAEDRLKPLLVIYYSGNNLTGSQQSQTNDPKHTNWTPVVPGTQSETLYQWACAQSG